MAVSAYQQLRRHLKESGIENPDLEARWILKHVLNVTDADLITGTGRAVSVAEQAHIDGIVARRLSGEPLSRIFGEREFWGLSFKLGPETLDPRPDTEIIIEQALATFPVKQRALDILDLGTGTGCIIITLLKELPESSGVAIDFSPGALQTARENARAHSVEGRIRFVCGDWARALDQQFDLIVSNPPYIASSVIPNLDREVRNHDPILALDGGEDGLQAYKKIFSDLKRILKPGGSAFFEIGFDQEATITRLSEDSRIRILRVHPDFAGRPRVLEIACGDK